MRQIMILIFCLGFISCSKVETASINNIDNKTPINSINNKVESTLTVSPTVETNVPLKLVKPTIKLNSKQQKYLNESLPLEVREILEKAEKFEILAEVKLKDKNDGLKFEPNRISKISNENDKRKILEIFYKDAATDQPPASCFIPHHGIRANYQNKIVEIEICFECSRFTVKSPSGNFEGTIVRQNLKSEDYLNQIIKNQSIEIK